MVSDYGRDVGRGLRIALVAKVQFGEPPQNIGISSPVANARQFSGPNGADGFCSLVVSFGLALDVAVLVAIVREYAGRLGQRNSARGAAAVFDVEGAIDVIGMWARRVIHSDAVSLAA